MKHIQGSLLTGYVTVTVKGDMPELFFQACINQEIPVWNIRKIEKNVCVGNIKLADISNLKRIRRNGNYKLSFTKRRGLPFVIKGLFKKKELILGFVLSILLIIFLSNIIWKIEITGVPKDIEEKISKQLDQYGIHPGAWTFTLRAPSEVQQKLTNDIPELLWIGVQRKGTTIYLEGVEKLIVKEEEVKGPRNLVATKKGVIKKMYVSKGLPKVFVNDYVEPGDILVSGVLDANDNSEGEGSKKQTLVSSEGEVIARTWYEVSVTVPLKAKYELLSGNQQKKYFMEIGNVQFPIWGFGTPEYEDVQVENNNNPVYFLKWQLPIKINESIIHEKTYNLVNRTKEEAVKVGIKQAKQELKLQLGPEAKIISEKILHEASEHGKVKLDLYITVEENIVKAQPINKDDKKE